MRLAVAWLAGVDGCTKGWFRICRDSGTGDLAFDVLESASDLIQVTPCPTLVELDIPIGLPARGPRECDRAARKVLGPRRSSVFPAPVRAALAANDRQEASDITQRIDGRRVSVQAWAICCKIREVDDTLRQSSDARRKIAEVHPEVSFWAWNGERPMDDAKKERNGLRQRLALAEEWLGAGILEKARGRNLKKDLADDDIVDAIAGLWTVHRIASGEAHTLPGQPNTDDTGLPMRIVY
jgi:predicted RNase H-like nuclease